MNNINVLYINKIKFVVKILPAEAKNNNKNKQNKTKRL